MLPLQRTRARVWGVPPAGAKVIFIGDSISDLQVACQSNCFTYCATIAQHYGWTILGANAIVNTGMEGPSAANWTGSNATLTADATHAQEGTYALKIVPAGVTACFAYPTDNNGNGYQAHGNTFGMLPGFAYTFSASFFVPSGSGGTPRLVLGDRVGAGSYAFTFGAAVSTFGAWVRMSVTRTITAGATEAFCYVDWSSTDTSKAIWIDAVQLECNSAATSYVNFTHRAAQAGTLLQATDNLSQNFIGNQYRFTDWAPADVVVMLEGTNDIFHATDVGSTKTEETWRTALRTALALFNANGGTPNPLIIVLSLDSLPGMSVAATNCPGWNKPQSYVYYRQNAAAREEALAAGAVWVDISGMPAADLNADNIHPNAAGHAYIVSAIQAALGI